MVATKADCCLGAKLFQNCNLTYNSARSILSQPAQAPHTAERRNSSPSRGKSYPHSQTPHAARTTCNQPQSSVKIQPVAGPLVGPSAGVGAAALTLRRRCNLIDANSEPPALAALGSAPLAFACGGADASSGALPLPQLGAPPEAARCVRTRLAVFFCLRPDAPPQNLAVKAKRSIMNISRTIEEFLTSGKQVGWSEKTLAGYGRRLQHLEGWLVERTTSLGRRN
jgi:hypothetical protein